MSSPCLAAVALGYTPLIDRQSLVTATRLTVFPLRTDVRAADLLADVAEVWPSGGSSAVLNVLNEALLAELLNASPPAHLMIEVPAFMAGDAAHADALLALRKRGSLLLLKGQPAVALAAPVLACFKFIVLDEADEARPDNAPGLPRLHTGINGAEALATSFARGAQAVFGWPTSGQFEPPAGAVKKDVAGDLQVIVELMSRVDAGEDIDRLEQTLKRDPSLAFKLLRFLNSAAFGLPVEVSSFRHAIMLLGYARLKRWLALLLTTASKDHTMRPIMYAALRRGLLMEELARSLDDAEMRDELFICGLFSLLDHMLKQPFSALLGAIPMPERVRQALVEGSGPYQPYLELVHAIEQASVHDYRSAAEQLMLEPADINPCVMRALAKAAQLE
jgi:EAL and modified HD-GYP domain-containing signal transduction protein